MVRDRRSTWIFFGALWAYVASLASAAGARESGEPTRLIATHCVACHNAEARTGGIDLSRRDGAGDVFASGRLARAVRSGRMPPATRLPRADAEAIARWAETGAEYPAQALTVPKAPTRRLWSVEPLGSAPPPATRYDRISTHPIDRFVFARLEAKGIAPGPLADRRALLRRASLVLTGLPPTAQELATFLADRRGDAWERQVDRLLASPAYGERMARLWLDVVRFGESHGYEQNHLRDNAWPYRDWVIKAFERDLPWSKFVGMQLASDVLAPGDPAEAAATGFLVAGIHDTVGIQTEEGTRQQRSNDLDDMVATTGQAFLGLTVGCARCHDHKFDPIPQADYYRLAAVFAGVRHAERELPAEKANSALASERARVSGSLMRSRNRLQEIEAGARQAVLAAKGVAPAARPAVNSRRNVEEFAEVEARHLRFVVLASSDGHEPCIDELQVFGKSGDDNVALATRGTVASASGELPGFAIHRIAHLNDGRLGNDHSWISNTAGTGEARLTFARVERIGRVVFSRDAGDVPRFDDRLPVRYRIETSLDGKAWTEVASDAGRAGNSDYIHPDELVAALSTALRAERDRLKGAISADAAELARLEGQGKAYIGRFGDPEPVHVLRRGDVMQQGPVVAPGAFSCIAGLPSDFGDLAEPRRRAELARWIADPGNPLTPRVAVNRIWQQDFGRGIVATPSDFGRNGAAPTHPELLDWLARDFVRNGGSVKRLHRLILTSHAWRQSAAARAEGMAKDAGNTLLWRHPLRRMEAEMVRDSVLQASGKLDRRRFGPGFRLYDYKIVNIAIYEPLGKGGPETWRRGIYHQSARAVRDTLMGAFDCPESSVRTARRESTTTALQALALWNGPFTVEQAGFVAEAASATADPIATAFLRILGRRPDAAEALDARGIAANLGLPALCRALLNTNEFLYY